MLSVRFSAEPSGYAGLGSIANLEPEFIKLDIALIRGIEGSPVKQHLVETLVRFANEQGTTVVAEGVERTAEYETVRALGVHLVQGFLLHRPERADAEVPAVVVANPQLREATLRRQLCQNADDTSFEYREFRDNRGGTSIGGTALVGMTCRNADGTTQTFNETELVSAGLSAQRKLVKRTGGELLARSRSA